MRMLFSVLLGHTKSALASWKAAGYQSPVMVLGVNKARRDILSEISQKASGPVIISPSDAETLKGTPAWEIYSDTCRASEIYRYTAQIKSGKQILSASRRALLII